MADFCKQCSLENFGEDHKDFQFNAPDGLVTAVLCEGCGPTYVDNDGNCVCDWCLKRHGKKGKTMKHDKELTHATRDSTGFAAPLNYIGTVLRHSGNKKTYIITGVCWLGETDQWGVSMKARGENIDIVRPYSHVNGKRDNGELRYAILS